MKRIAPMIALVLIAAATFPLGVYAAAGDDVYNAGLLALKSGDGPLAVDLLSQALAKRPDDYRYHNDRGVAHRLAGELEQALSDYSKAIELKPDYTHALNNRGLVYAQQSRYDHAIRDFSEALKHGGIESKIHTNLGYVYAKQGNHAAAIQQFEKATTFRPVDNRSFVFKAQSLEEVGEKEKALKAYHLAMGLVRDSSTLDTIEKRIRDLEKALGKDRGSTRGIRGPAAESEIAQGGTQTPESRRILLARPLPQQPPAVKRSVTPPAETGIETIEALDRRARARNTEKFSTAAAEIYRQGREFFEKGDWAKALVRFEDCRQLEQRRKNEPGAAWCALETGRVYSRTGDHSKAGAHFGASVKAFRKLRMPDDAVLALVELAANRRSAGQREEAAKLYSEATDEAVSVGHRKLSKVIEELSVSKVDGPTFSTAVSQARPGGAGITVADSSGKTPGLDTKAPGAAPAPPSRTAPAGPGIGATGAKQQGEPLRPAQTARVQQTAPKGPDQEVAATPPLPATRANPSLVETRRGPGRGVESEGALAARPSLSRVKPANPTVTTAVGDKRVREYLAELKHLRAGGDLARMVPVLEALGDLYERQYESTKALYAFQTAAAFREKTGLDQGLAGVLARTALIKEAMGRTTEALEDVTRSMVLSEASKQPKADQDLGRRATRLATKLGLDPKALIPHYETVWRARRAADSQAETRALYEIAALFEKANRIREALAYYERIAASMMTEKARMYVRIGEVEAARDTYERALEAFKRLDYSRYLGLIKRLKPVAGGAKP